MVLPTLDGRFTDSLIAKVPLVEVLDGEFTFCLCATVPIEEIFDGKFTNAISATIFDTLIFPNASTFTRLLCRQIDLNTTFGRSNTTFFWNFEENSEDIIETLGRVAVGETYDTNNTPVSEFNFSLYEIVDPNPAPYAETTIDIASVAIYDVINVIDSTGFNPGDLIRLGSLAVDNLYGCIKEINGNNITLCSRVGVDLDPGTIIKRVNSVLKINGSDYSVVTSTGLITLVETSFTLNKEIVFIYKTELSNHDHFELYLAEGDEPVVASTGFSRPTLDDVSSFPNIQTVDLEILSTSRSFADVLNPSENGEDLTYYLFAVDADDAPSFPLVTKFETIPSIPQNLATESASESITISWDALPVFSDANVDGFRVYRSDGDTYNEFTAIIISDGVVTGTSFVDSVENVTNRVSSVEAPFPENGRDYSYKVSSIDETTTWTTGTQNRTLTQEPVESAEKL